MSAVRLDTNADDDLPISWLNADPRRAPVRNDVINGLEAGLCPLPFWFVLFGLYYDFPASVRATVLIGVISFFVVFILSWARMTTARHSRACIRSPRTRTKPALLGSVAVALVTVYASPSRSANVTFDVAIALLLGVAAVLIALSLEQFAVSIPAAHDWFA